MKHLSERQKLTITTIVINSENFLLTAKYLIQNLGLKVKKLECEECGIKRLYLHAASDISTDALEVCLTNDHVAAKRFPVLLGAVAENQDQPITYVSMNDSFVESRSIGSIGDIFLFKEDQPEFRNPEVPVCILPRQEFSQCPGRTYSSDEVEDWLRILGDDGLTSGRPNLHSWLHRMTVESKAIHDSIEYYEGLGFYVEDVSEDFGQETYNVSAGTKIGLHLKSTTKSRVAGSRVAFSVNVEGEMAEFPKDYNTEKNFSTANLRDAVFSFRHFRFTYDFSFVDINRCTWKLHAEK